MSTCENCQTTPLPTFITISELAEILAVPAATIRKWRETGGGPVAYRIGGQLRYTITDVAAWLDSRREAPAGGAE